MDLFSRRQFYDIFLINSRKIDHDILCKLSICIKCQRLHSGRIRTIFQNVVSRYFYDACQALKAKRMQQKSFVDSISLSRHPASCQLLDHLKFHNEEQGKPQKRIGVV